MKPVRSRIPARDGGGIDQGSTFNGGEQWLDAGYFFEKPIGYADGLLLGVTKRDDS